MPKLMKFKGQRSQDKIRHILIFWRRTECAFYVLREKANFVYEFFVVSCFGEAMLPFHALSGNSYIGRTPYGGRPVINIITRDPSGVRAGSERQPAGTLGYRTVPVIYVD